MSIKIYPIQTGTVRIKAAQRIRKTGGLLRVITDKEWAGWLPIYAWVIDHPEGIIVVDTGDTARTTLDPDYFPRWHPYYRTSLEMNIGIHQEIGPQMQEMGINSKDVKTLILTHFHTDHAGGLYYFPESEILVSGKDHRLAQGISGKMLGYLPHRWPAWFSPVYISFNNKNLGPFEHTYRVTKAGDVFIVPTPGHTPDHVSVIVRSDDVHYFLAGDTTYSEKLLLENTPDGISPRASVTLDTMSRIREFGRKRPLVYLPTHDPESAYRLNHKQLLTMEQKEAKPAA